MPEPLANPKRQPTRAPRGSVERTPDRAQERFEALMAEGYREWAKESATISEDGMAAYRETLLKD